jgi:hypothetical protein
MRPGLKRAAVLPTDPSSAPFRRLPRNDTLSGRGQGKSEIRNGDVAEILNSSFQIPHSPRVRGGKIRNPSFLLRRYNMSQLEHSCHLSLRS